MIILEYINQISQAFGGNNHLQSPDDTKRKILSHPGIKVFIPKYISAFWEPGFEAQIFF